MESVSEEDGKMFNSMSLPKLREITGYLFLYRVYRLRSLRNLFPNLAVIRGQELFFDFALILYEIEDLEDLGLSSLTVISRGAVSLEKNRELCFLDTIDWDRICSKNNVRNHFISQNKEVDQCNTRCPTTASGAEMCPMHNSRKRTVWDGEVSREQPVRLCWDQHSCQKGKSHRRAAPIYEKH